MQVWLWICVSLLGGLFFAKFLYLISTGSVLPITKGALFIPTPSTRTKTLLDALPMNSKELFLDLGCGDGRVLREARKRWGVQAMGFEVNLLAYLAAKVRNFRLKGVQIRWKNFWEVDLSHADVVFFYLFPDVMERLAKKLEAELRPGSKVVSSNFPLPGWRPFRVLQPHSGRHRDPIYIYRFPSSCQAEEEK